MVGDSEYIIFVDESGTPMTTKVDKDFPIFSLQFLVIKKLDYSRIAVPAIVWFKLKHHGSDSMIIEKPYALFLHRLLNDVAKLVRLDGGFKTRCRVVIESRGGEDAQILSSFEAYKGKLATSLVEFELEMVSKERNLPGLQLADLVALPVAKSCIPGAKASKSWATVAKKVAQKIDLTSELRFRLNESRLS